jgi:hypothetical protein
VRCCIQSAACALSGCLLQEIASGSGCSWGQVRSGLKLLNDLHVKTYAWQATYVKLCVNTLCCTAGITEAGGATIVYRTARHSNAQHHCYTNHTDARLAVLHNALQVSRRWAARPSCTAHATSGMRQAGAMTDCCALAMATQVCCMKGVRQLKAEDRDCSLA